MTPKRVHIVGGGIAGMTTALKLLNQGVAVSMYESTARLGGKAGAEKNNEQYDEHGYHLFPAWYLNFWNIMDELKLSGNFKECYSYTQLEKNTFPKYKSFKNLVSLKYFFQNMFSGILPPAEMFLLAYFAVDLMSAPMSDKAFLDQITLNGFMKSRFYSSEDLALKCQDFILNGVSTPSYLVSAMTMKILLNYWTKYPDPTFSILKGNLQQFLVEPFEQRLSALGCEIYKNHTLSNIDFKADQTFALTFNAGSPAELQVSAETLLMAIPGERLCDFIPAKLFDADTDIFKCRYLVAKPMAALNIYFKKKFENIVSSHIILLGSKFHISLIDVSQHWNDYNHTVFNMICSDLTLLKSFNDQVVIERVIGELKEFFPFIKDEDIDHVSFLNNLDSPILTNEVGSWPNRPYNKTQIPNLFLAGDFTKTHVDLVCVEGALVSGLKAYNDIIEGWDSGKKTTILKPKVYPNWLLQLAKLGLFPFALGCKLALSLSKNKKLKAN